MSGLITKRPTPPPPDTGAPPPQPIVPDSPCPKCDSGDVWMRYCDGCRTRLYDATCRHGDPEHFHRGCRRCRYEWRTDDVIDAQVTCTDFPYGGTMAP